MLSWFYLYRLVIVITQNFIGRYFEENVFIYVKMIEFSHNVQLFSILYIYTKWRMTSNDVLRFFFDVKWRQTPWRIILFDFRIKGFSCCFSLFYDDLWCFDFWFQNLRRFSSKNDEKRLLNNFLASYDVVFHLWRLLSLRFTFGVIRRPSSSFYVKKVILRQKSSKSWVRYGCGSETNSDNKV